MVTEIADDIVPLTKTLGHQTGKSAVKVNSHKTSSANVWVAHGTDLIPLKLGKICA